LNLELLVNLTKLNLPGVLGLDEEQRSGELDDDQIAEKIRAHPPSCVAGLDLSTTELPVPWNEAFKTVYQAGCKCGGKTGMILGYPLSDYNPSFDGNLFVTPIAFQCAQCCSVSEVIDTAVHGYHAEVGKLEGGVGSATIRGSGPRSVFKCPNCNKTGFQITVGFVYWDFDIMYDEPDLSRQNFFNVFLMYGHCQNCHHISPVTDLGKY
jgi:hypothetical protein